MSLQNHVHIALTLGNAPEYAPVYKWKATDRLDVPSMYGAIRVAVNGKRRTHVLTKNGVPARWDDKRYIVLIAKDEQYTTEQRVEILKAMMDRTVYVCDHYHSDDGDDHTPFVVPMFMEVVPELKVFDPKLSRFYVQVTLKDLRDGDKS